MVNFSVCLNRHVFVMVTARLNAVMNGVFEPSSNRRVKNFLCPTSSEWVKVEELALSFHKRLPKTR